MRIGIDARMMGPKQGGLGRYIEQLILHLQQIDGQNEYIIFLRKENWDEISLNKNFTKLLANIPWYGWREQFELPKIIKQAKVDLTHFPHWNVPLFYDDPFVVTIHDLLLLHYPTRRASALGPITYWFKNLAFKKVLRHAVKKARHIIAPSECVKQDLHETLDVPLEKISVTHLAPINPVAYNLKPVTDDRESRHVISYKLQVARPYILYVGVAYPHKNLHRLLESWQLFQNKYGKNHQLVLAGKRNYFYNKLLNNNSTIEQLNNGTVVYTDYLPDSELAKIYSNASLYVFPSLYEGFGLPPLEAMLHNVPVISSDAACLPEILKDAALYFNPNNIEEMAEAMRRGLTDKNLREKLQANGQKLLALYSWDKTAKRTLEVYLQIKT